MKKCYSRNYVLAFLILSPFFIFFSHAQGTTDFDQWRNKNEAENYTPRHECSVVQAGNRFYLMGGRENAKTIDVYDYTTNTWTQIPDSPPVEFNHFQATEYKGLIWVIGAFKNNDFPSETPADYIWAFDPVNEEWIQGPEIPDNRKRGSAGLVVYNDKFYIAGGNTIGHNGGYVNWFDEYDPATGTWTPLANAPRARDHFHAARIGTKMYLSGGRLSGGEGGTFRPTIAEVDVYDFTTSTWSTLPADQNLPTPRGAPAVATFNDKLLVIGGEVENQQVYGEAVNDALKITEQYDPVTQQWTRLPDLNSERHGTQAIVSGNGIFVLAGSPNKGGGNQKNMEYLGGDNPVGVPNTASTLVAPDVIDLEPGASTEFTLRVTGGNMGMFIRSMALTGPGAANFSLTSGALENAFLDPESSRTITVSLTGSGQNSNAVLTIAYGASSELDILLKNGELSAGIDNPGTQYNKEDDTVSVPIQGNDNNGAFNYSATGLPPNLTINASTGVISGTVSSGENSTGAFEEENGLLVIEAESGDIVPGWTETTEGGATGIAAGRNSFNSINGGTIPYQVTVTTPGVYRFNWRTFFSGKSSSDENDNWLRFPNNDDVWFFGYKGNPVNEASVIGNLEGELKNIVFPKGSSRITSETTPKGGGSQGFFKIYRSGGKSKIYDWQAMTFDDIQHNVYVRFENPGTYTMEISERSAGHTIDKMALYKLDGREYSDTELTAAAESVRGGGNSSGGAAANSPYQVRVTATDNTNSANSSTVEFTWIIDNSGIPIARAEASPLTGQVPLAVSFTGSGSLDDEGIAVYQWDFGDQPTSSSNLADPSFTFTEPGTFNVTLTVTDADGNTDSESLAIVVDPKPVYTIDATAGENGSISPNGEIEVIEGADKAFTITPNEGYAISEVSVDGILQDAIDTFTFNAVDGPHTITASFGIAEYVITASSTAGGSIDPEGTDFITNGSDMPYSILPDAGFRILDVLVDGVSQGAVDLYEFKEVDGPHTIEAIFEEIPTYAITANAGEGGTISPEGTTNVLEGGSLSFSVTADTGFTFDYFLVDGAVVRDVSEYGFQNLGENHTIEAIFRPIADTEYAITATATIGGTLSPNGSIAVAEDGTQIFSIVADTGFEIADIKVDGSSISIADSYTFANVVEDHSLEVVFVEEVIIDGNKAPKAEAVSDAIQGTAPFTVNFDGTDSTDDQGIANYEWNFGDGSPEASGALVEHTFNEPGEYTVWLTVADTEGETSTISVIITVTAPSEAAPSETGDEFRIFPNPASVVVNLGLDPEIELQNIYIYNMEGRLMRALDAKYVKFEGGYRINVSLLSEGLYFIGSQDADGKAYHAPMLIKR